MTIITIVGLITKLIVLYPFFPFMVTFGLTMIMEIITIVQKIRKRNLWLVKITVYLRLIVSVIAFLLAFLGILWSILGTTGDGGGWGRGQWQDFIEASGKEWKVYFGDRIARIAILIWFGTIVQLGIAVNMYQQYLSIVGILGLVDEEYKIAKNDKNKQGDDQINKLKNK